MRRFKTSIKYATLIVSPVGTNSLWIIPLLSKNVMRIAEIGLPSRLLSSNYYYYYYYYLSNSLCPPKHIYAREKHTTITSNLRFTQSGPFEYFSTNYS